ncbi:hypothetical protein DRW42_19050 [Pedobacter miscanthi]|uniref:Arm DNA-binding domain-containing protein n=1 Tax=Pedobacter miscanthi TaxID=2259170 RepID=A0A366KSW0_9SPHI|nr:hypothetical protein DRW42_19050 [Pedobacter miscanthi]
MGFLERKIKYFICTIDNIVYTTPQISANDNLASRSYVYFYYNKKHYKFYNGNKLNLPIFPNHAKTIKERAKLLHKLQQEYTKALNNNWTPTGQTNLFDPILPIQ